IGGYIIAQVLKRVAAHKTKPAYSLLCLNAIQEEIGGHGAMMATYRLKPDLCMCLDVTHATDTPGIDPAKHGLVKLGGGPSVTHGTANHPLVIKHLLEVAKGKSIPIQHESSSRFSGTDTDKIFHSREAFRVPWFHCPCVACTRSSKPRIWMTSITRSSCSRHL
ncbi:MAG: hypothetical protein RLY69_1162, partial [Verrucomicrobiota bacterium]